MDKDRILESVLKGDADVLEVQVKEALDSGLAANDLVTNHLTPAMREVGRLFEAGELYIPEMMLSAIAVRRALAILRPALVESDLPSWGVVVAGTVQGDLHDIGKSLVCMMLEGAGFEVHDLGVNVPPERFVEAVTSLKPKIVAMSALLTTTIPKMEVTIQALTEAGVRQGLIIMVGGAAVTPEFAKSIGADGYAYDAAGAARRAEELASA
ncbi:MAG TPA: corrinoid protein [Anaerolineales bacterium]|nr:corrinoid protein [Anaerolineales bacterium]